MGLESSFGKPQERSTQDYINEFKMHAVEGAPSPGSGLPLVVRARELYWRNLNSISGDFDSRREAFLRDTADQLKEEFRDKEIPGLDNTSPEDIKQVLKTYFGIEA